jgi:serine/threonine protein kinase
LSLHFYVITPPRGAVLSEDAELEKRGFTVGKTLGEGAFGTVKGAFIRESKLLVAIKVIDRSRVAGKVSERALLLERNIHSFITIL